MLIFKSKFVTNQLGTGQHPDGQQVVCISQVLSLFRQRGCVTCAGVTGGNATGGGVTGGVTLAMLGKHSHKQNCSSHSE